MASIAGLEVLDEDFNRDRVKIAFNPLATDSDKRFAVQDASHLKDKNGFQIFQKYLKMILIHLSLSLSIVIIIWV